jgi:hypothetical protein
MHELSLNIPTAANESLNSTWNSNRSNSPQTQLFKKNAAINVNAHYLSNTSVPSSHAQSNAKS